MSVADKKKAYSRLSALQLAESLGNVTEACRQQGLSRAQFYQYKHRFKTHGLEGLEDLSPINRRHPLTTPPEVVDTIIQLSLENPQWGCVRLSDQLKLRDISVSSPTVQKILIQNRMGSKNQRLRKLEKNALNSKVDLTPEQVMILEKANPCFKERHRGYFRPGELLTQNTLLVGSLEGIGRVYAQTVIDICGSYAFGYLHVDKLPAHAAAILHRKVLPQYKEWGFEVKSIQTDSGREYRGKDYHPYKLYLALNEIRHCRLKGDHPSTNGGYIERFNRVVMDEFFRPKLKGTRYDSLEQLQNDFDLWLKHYNEERRHPGFPNKGKRPINIIRQFNRSIPQPG
ncbi:MAG: transposase [Candidatus Nitrohelix vancouverensis]|uniref:Transposase n=1 Tax=Candidatus Nitrohelix vancouverensis TaxID=2705534 RepID=A0A7T0G2C4_9BACT|nr:MAG: transposase [Candidatus Nitrohelix vancouverensis]